MSLTQSAATEHTNFYSAAKNDPEVLAKRRQRVAALDSEIRRMQTVNPGKRPNWSQERLMQMDRAALERGKRCIMWDDTGAGFYLMVNWDWVANRPMAPTSQDRLFEPGWWINAKQILQPPLIDPKVPENELSAWLDSHTMAVHHHFLPLRHKVKPGGQPGTYVLEDEYWDRLQALPPAGQKCETN